MRKVILGLACTALVAVAACGKKEDTGVAPATGIKSGKYQGKPDTNPWDNDPAKFAAAKWEKGNKAAWENQLKERNQNQNDYTRTQ